MTSETYQQILVPVALQRYLGFAPVALRQRDIAIALARQFGAAVTVISIDAPVTLLPHLESTETKLARYIEPFAEQSLEHTTVYRQGKPSREIQDYIEEGASPDLMIVGSHSKSGPLDVGLGSTAGALSRKSTAPVLMIWPTEEEVDRTREMMIPHYPLVFPYG